MHRLTTVVGILLAVQNVWATSANEELYKFGLATFHRVRIEKPENPLPKNGVILDTIYTVRTSVSIKPVPEVNNPLESYVSGRNLIVEERGKRIGLMKILDRRAYLGHAASQSALRGTAVGFTGGAMLGALIATAKPGATLSNLIRGFSAGAAVGAVVLATSYGLFSLKKSRDFLANRDHYYQDLGDWKSSPSGEGKEVSKHGQ
ncbi:MAG: hypothetical protein HY401_08615 [Elusimicrobia bacterium]|nr:hypothetical protein [Elusimicrobiota bacterium]